MSRQTTALVAAGAFIAVALSGCAASGTGSPAPSDAVVTGSPVAVADEMTALCKQMISEGLPIEAASALAEASGYTSRISSIDGQQQPTTKDYREDRFTLETTNGTVTACTIG